MQTMVNLVDDYFVKKMKDPVYAAAYEDLEKEFEAKRLEIKNDLK